MIMYMHVHVGATGEEVRSTARSCSSSPYLKVVHDCVCEVPLLSSLTGFHLGFSSRGGKRDNFRVKGGQRL